MKHLFIINPNCGKGISYDGDITYSSDFALSNKS